MMNTLFLHDGTTASRHVVQIVSSITSMSYYAVYTEQTISFAKYGRVICRCETITEGEIVDTIHRPVGARTVDGVKRRTRAGMGRCQGGFCGPRVTQILARELNIPVTEVRKEMRKSYMFYNKETQSGGKA